MDFIKIPLPEIKTFKSNKKDKDPYLKFYEHITDYLKTPINTFSVSNVRLNEEDYHELKELSYKWFVKQSGISFLKKKYKDRQFSFHDSHIGPYGNKDLERGFIYIKKDWKPEER